MQRVRWISVRATRKQLEQPVQKPILSSNSKVFQQALQNRQTRVCLEMLPQVKVNTQQQIQLIEQLFESNEPNKLEWIEKLGTVVLPENMYSWLFQLYYKENNLVLAQKRWRWMQEHSIPQTTRHMNWMLKILQQNKMEHESLKFFDECVASGIEPNFDSWGQLIKCVGNGSLPWLTVDVLKRAQDHGFPINRHLLSFSLAAFAKQGITGGMDFCMKLAEKYQIKPDLSIMHTLMTGYKNSGQFNKSLAIYQEIQQKHQPNLQTFNIVLDVYLKQKDYHNATCLFESLLESPFQPDLITFSTMMSLSLRQKDYQKLQFYFDKMQDYQIQPNVYCYNMMFSAFPLKQQQLYDTMIQTCKPNQRIFATLLSNALKQDTLEHWLRVFEESKIMADDIIYKFMALNRDLGTVFALACKHEQVDQDLYDYCCLKLGQEKVEDLTKNVLIRPTRMPLLSHSSSQVNVVQMDPPPIVQESIKQLS
ncbi:hypothetical protein EDD86DRAFT_213543, partial [Gorgonomyces haynaldii]